MGMKVSFTSMGIGDIEVHALKKTGKKSGMHAAVLIKRSYIDAKGLRAAISKAVEELMESLGEEE